MYSEQSKFCFYTDVNVRVTSPDECEDADEAVRVSADVGDVHLRLPQFHLPTRLEEKKISTKKRFTLASVKPVVV